MTPQVHPHPEWKRLAAEIQPLLAQERFTYEELATLAGVDVRTSRGRQQFDRFRKHALNEWGVWFECDRTKGYRVTAPVDHPGCAMARVRRGRRQMKNALSIAVKTDERGATGAVIAAKRQIASSLGAILQAATLEAKKIRPLLAAPMTSSGAETLKSIEVTQ